MFWDGGGSAEANSGVRMACDAQPGISPRLVLAKPLAPAQGSGAGGALPSPSDTAAYGEQPPTAATANRNGGGNPLTDPGSHFSLLSNLSLQKLVMAFRD